MAEKILKDREVRSSDAGKLGDGGGLWLYTSMPSGGSPDKASFSRKWVFRFTLDGKRREMGLGGYPAVSLEDARMFRDGWRAHVARGENPITLRQAEQRASRAAKPTLSQMMDETFEARSPSLKNGGNALQWGGPVRLHLLPSLGERDVREISQEEVAQALKSIWKKTPESASKALVRLKLVMEHASAKGFKNPNPTLIKDARRILGDQGRVVRHMPAMPWREIPTFYEGLSDTTTELALRLVVLTACRSVEVRGAKLSEIADSVWTIPAERMKMGRPHRVPLSDAAKDVIEAAAERATGDHLFAGPKGKPLSDMAFTAFFRRRDIPYRAHGFRSSFRDWAAEMTEVPREICESCLAHETATKVETAYRRTDFLERRSILMANWANHVAGLQGEVVQMVRA